MKHPPAVSGLVQPDMPGDHLPLGHHGTAGERVAPTRVGHRGIPHYLACPCVKSHDMGIRARQEDLVGVERDRAYVTTPKSEADR
jgi:hypothetical protein